MTNNRRKILESPFCFEFPKLHTPLTGHESRLPRKTKICTRPELYPRCRWQCAFSCSIPWTDLLFFRVFWPRRSATANFFSRAGPPWNWNPVYQCIIRKLFCSGVSEAEIVRARKAGSFLMIILAARWMRYSYCCATIRIVRGCAILFERRWST